MKPKFLVIMISTFVGLLPLFITHRLLTWPYLAEGLANPKLSESLQYFSVGIMSDLWVAAVLAFLTIPCVGFCHIFMRRQKPLVRLLNQIARFLPVLIVLVWTVLLVGHQSYVEFFRHQFIPFHVRYFGDGDFFAANASSVINPRSLLTLGSGLALAIGSYLIGLYGHRAGAIKQTKFSEWIAPWILIVFAAAIHSQQIHWRVQWYVPEKLQMNVIEKFFATLTRSKPVKELNTVETKALVNVLAPTTNTSNDQSLKSILFQNGNRPLSPVEELLRTAVRARLESGKQVLALTVLLESFRPSETGVYDAFRSTADRPSLTPSFDQLATEGILFQHAYSTGNVTRTGQEAAWCGYPGGQETSTMRGREDVTISCLPKVANEYRNHSTLITSWLHGGEGGFDGQETYWRKQMVNHILTKRDFTAETPRTGWGIGDRSLFARAADFLREQSHSQQNALHISLVLTVTNHIPWAIPGDSPPELAHRFEQLANEHPSFKTTLYTDHALGEFRKKLTEYGLWDDALIVVASDHGTLEPAWKASTAPDPQADQLTRIVLVLAGGIISESKEKILASENIRNHLSKGTVSQASIATFWSNVLNLPMQTFAPGLFSTDKLPVYADLGSALYLPPDQTRSIPGFVLAKEKVSSADESWLAHPNDSNPVELVKLHYRAFFGWLNNPELRSKP